MASGKSKSMSRLSETIDVIDTINKAAEIMTPKMAAVELLAEIAKSLAVIADKMEEHEQNRD